MEQEREILFGGYNARNEWVTGSACHDDDNRGWMILGPYMSEETSATHVAYVYQYTGIDLKGKLIFEKGLHGLALGDGRPDTVWLGEGDLRIPHTGIPGYNRPAQLIATILTINIYTRRGEGADYQCFPLFFLIQRCIKNLNLVYSIV